MRPADGWARAVPHSTLRIAKALPEARALVEELADFRANISEARYTSFGAREGAQDDLVMGVVIGLWWATWAASRAALYAVHI